MVQVHFIQILRKLKHPQLQEYVEASDRVDQLGCQFEELEKLAAGLEPFRPNDQDSLRKLTELETRFHKLKQQFRPALRREQQLRTQIQHSLQTPKN